MKEQLKILESHQQKSLGCLAELQKSVAGLEIPIVLLINLELTRESKGGRDGTRATIGSNRSKKKKNVITLKKKQRDKKGKIKINKIQEINNKGKEGIPEFDR